MTRQKAPSSPRPAPLFAPVDIASLVVFRVGFGAIMLWEMYRYAQYDWIARYWIEPGFHFTYYGFDWVRPWPGDGMYYHCAVLALLAAGILFGFFYRICTALFFIGFTYLFLLEQARYLNHFYLVSLLSFLLILVPAHRAFSFDALSRPRLRSSTAPAWSLWILQAQIAIVYFYGGLAKLNADWLRGEPMRRWLASRSELPVLGPFVEEEWMVSIFVYGGLLLDLLIVPLLLWRKTRLLAFLLGVTFHLTNAWIFQIGIFPWFMIVATTLFFDPDWPRRLLRRPTRPALIASPPAPAAAGLITAFFVLYLAIQCLVPLRHFLYPGNVSWTEQGHKYAWHMKLRSKSGRGVFEVTNPASNETWTVNGLDYLTDWQASKMWGHPELILQMARHLAGTLRAEGYPEIEVRARVYATLNGRRPALLIDPTVDLGRQPRDWRPAPWILPLLEPLPPPNKKSERPETLASGEEP